MESKAGFFSWLKWLLNVNISKHASLVGRNVCLSINHPESIIWTVLKRKVFYSFTRSFLAQAKPLALAHLHVYLFL